VTSQRPFLNSLKWAYSGNLGEKAFSALFTFILAGILGPSDFGIVSIAILYVSFLQMFLDQGLATALIQRKEIEQKHLDAVFWMNLALGFVLVLVSIACSQKWATLNHTPQIARIIPILSVSILIEALTVVQTALLRRQMDFKSLSIRTNVAVLVSGVVGIGMAIAGFRLWALVGQQLVRDTIALILLWRLSPWRPRGEFSWRHLKTLLRFSIPNFTAQLGLFAGSQADAVILGVLFGPVAVGLYRVADRVVNSLVTVAMASIQVVSLSEFSRFQKEPEQLRRSVFTCIRLTSAATLPALAGLIMVGDSLMATIGPKWSPASNVVKILSALGMALVFSFFTGSLLQALGRPRRLAALEWARAGVSTGVLAAAGLLVRSGSTSTQIAGIASARFVVGALVVTPVYVYILMRLSGLSLRDFGNAVTPSVLASVGVIGSVMLFQAAGWATALRPVVLLATESAIGGATGLAVLIGSDKWLRRSVAGMLQRRWRRQVAANELA
jgi:O-antigen/teichoic acid export membrane protein